MLATFNGETARHLSTRVHEHLFTDKKSSIFKHLKQNDVCRAECNVDCFIILDTAATKYQLKIKESLLISKYEPLLNKQVPKYQARLVL